MRATITIILLLIFNIILANPSEVYLLPKPKMLNWTNQKAFKSTHNNISDFDIKTIIAKEIPEAKNHQEEAYQLTVNQNNIIIKAVTKIGIYRAKQTLEQLIIKRNNYFEIPTCEITDWAAFRIRGFMHDLGRSYMSVKQLKKQLDILAKYKINIFHWHLTEDIAWRIESKIYPQLNDAKNMTRFKGKYYTHEEIKDIVDFCKKRHITVIPEVDMPGHSKAFTRTFGFDMQTEEGMKVLKKLIDEICEVFDVPYLHIGTDEIQFTNKNFVPEMVAYIRSKGKKVISWNPGWKYKQSEIDITHLWSYRGKSQKGIPAIDSRYHYINHFDTFGDIIMLYNSKIYNQNEANQNIQGAIIAVWNDRYVKSEENILLQNNFYPVMLAFAERAWKGGGFGYFDKKTSVLRSESDATFKEFADFERRMLWHKKHNFKGYPFIYFKQTNLKWNITDAFPNEGDLDKSFPPEKKIRKKYTYKGKTYHVSQVYGAGIYLRHVWGSLVPGFYDNPQENHTAYAYTWIKSDKEKTVNLWIEFQNYSRSEKDLPPPQGKWDYKGSRIWLNDKEIMPPNWQSNHSNKSNEIPLSNENLVARKPIKVKLKKGKNIIFLKLPVGKFRTKEIRLVKWMFNVAISDEQGL